MKAKILREVLEVDVVSNEVQKGSMVVIFVLVEE